MANQFRVDRVGMEIKREVNEILQKKVRDPRVQGITITDGKSVLHADEQPCF